MKRMVLVSSIIFILSLQCWVASYGEGENELASIRAALQDKQYKQAVKLIDAAIAKEDGQQDFLLYLKGLAFFYGKDFPNAVQCCDKILQEHKNSTWYRKAVFLQARCFIQLKRFKEAEAVYEREANRLISSDRKEEIASVYIRFAEALSRKPGKDELDAPPPNYKKAYNLYKKALELEVGRSLRGNLKYHLGRMMQLDKNYQQAIQEYREYLAEFDPNWMGSVDSPRRQKRQRMENPIQPGKYIHDARYHLAECQLASSQYQWARINFEDLLGLIPKSEKNTKLIRDSRFLITRTYRIPAPQTDDELALGVKVTRDFLKDFPDEPRAVSLAYEIGQAYQYRGRSDDAIQAYRGFVEKKGFSFPKGEEATKKDDSGESPAERFERLRMSATYKIGEVLFSQKDYAGAMKVWKQYTKQFPNGSQWTDAQKGIINSEFQIGSDLLAENKYDDAVKTWNEFISKHPLNPRCGQIMFAYGQIHYHLAEKDKTAASDEYRKAIAEWEKLVEKYPNTEESSLALFKIGKIYEEKLGDLEKALKAYRKLTWGSWRDDAQRRISEMTNKKLKLVTERTFRTNEPPRVKVSLRNIEKVTVSIYKLNLEAYWRKMHGITGIENLDIALIAPDKTWEYTVENYQKFKPFEQEIEIPIEGAGVYAVNVGEDDLEATTLVIRSNIDAIIKTSRREVLVFAEDMLEKQPVPKAKVLVSDGAKVICEGETGEDGIFHKKLDELNIVPQASIFVIKDGNIASNLLDISGLGLSKGLAPRGYLYTDRPAYRPGQKVSIRGIIRDVKNGAYAVSSGATYKLSIVDAQGRLLREEELQLSEFGTFHTEMSLDENAPLGEYRITAQLVINEAGKVDESKIYAGTFQVQRFQLEKMKLTIDFPRRVYFRGEKIEATFVASFYYGRLLRRSSSQVSNKPIRYELPNGQSYTEETDADGKLKVIFDTTSMRPGRLLTFRGSIEGENVQVEDAVYLAHLGFSISVIPSARVILPGEPFDVSVETLGANGKPVGKELTLAVFRMTQKTSHPILSEIPWMGGGKATRYAEVKVEEHKIVTDDKTGKGRIQLSLEKGGYYILRASGVDRFGQPVSDRTGITISDDEDAIKLRIFAERTNLKVGSAEKVRIHSRLNPTLALVTFEGEGIINYKVLQLKKGWNDLEFTVGHEHFPNFHIAVAVIDGQKLRTTGKNFTVERQLVVLIKPRKKFYLPGEEAEIEINATDQLGKPVRAELSLALVEEALFAIYPDNLRPIIHFFQEGTHRDAAMRTISSCTFRYQPATRQVVKEIQKEEDRLELAAREAELRERVADEARDLAFKEDKLAAGLAVKELARATPEEAAKEERFAGRRIAAAVKPKPRRPVVRRAVVKSVPKPLLPTPEGISTTQIKAREEFSGAGYWLPAIVTDADGKAVVKIPMPEKTTEWRLTARGCTIETLVGQVKTNTITRKDFFLDIKVPSIVTEGDKIRVLARIHNLTDFAGDVDLKLRLDIDGDKTVSTKRASVQKNSTAEVVFDEVEISAGKEARVEVTASVPSPKMTDGVARTIPIRPWGLEYADSTGGISSGDETVFVQLPKGQHYTSKRLTISVGPSISRTIFDLAQGVRGVQKSTKCIFASDAGSDLLAAASALGYIKEAGGVPTDNKTVMEHARSLISRIVVSQRDDGGWSWVSARRGSKANSDVYVSSRNLWALSEARRQGVIINSQTIEKAIKYLKQAFTKVEQNDDETKAVVLHALSRVGQADFAYANRLYRNRYQISTAALSYTALIFENLGKNEIAGEILDVLASQKREVKSRAGSLPVKTDNGTACYWPADKNRAWTASEVETTALVLLAMETVRPNSPLVKQAVEYLLSKRTFYGYSLRKAKGPVVAALAIYYQKTQFVKNDYRLNISVNGQEVKTVDVRREQPTMVIETLADILVDGQNKVNFDFEGRGNYSYTVTLRGFSPEFKDPESWKYPYVVARRYYHAPLEYRGRQIASSTTKITQLPDGARTYISVDINEARSKRYLIIDEYLPAGTMLVNDSVSGNYQHYEVGDGVITFYYPPNRRVRDYRYQLVSYAPGAYRTLPSVIRDAMRLREMRIGKFANLTVLAPGEKSKDEYQMNDAELYELGKAYFDDGKYSDALPLLSKLHERNNNYNERDVARMLLWIYTEGKYYNSQKIIEAFEILRERFPELYIPFDKILVVGRAYKDIEEFERAYLVYKATIDASFVNDSNVSAILQDEGQFLSSIDFMENLWREYPDTPQVVSAYFALSQALYSKVPEAEQLAKAERQIPLRRSEVVSIRKLLNPAGSRKSEGEKALSDVQRKITKLDLLKETIAMLSQFLTLYPEANLADDAAFSMVNAFLDLKDFSTVVRLCQLYEKRYTKSDYLTNFQYVQALGFFSQHKYDEAVNAAKIVADGKSKDRDLARYILGQIYHAQGKPQLAIEWYGKVRNIYPDAKESISYFEEKRVSLDEVNIFRPNEEVEITVKYRNIKEAMLQVYRVDLMKLYLREKDLSKITQVQLAGIEPEFSESMTLGDGKDYVDKERKVELTIKEAADGLRPDEGAYLIICRGDDLFSSGLVLITSLDIEMQEDRSGYVRVNIRDIVSGAYKEGVHVKAIGSADKQFKSGDTDLRGIFMAYNIRGKATVIARDEGKRYAFYRGKQWLGTPERGKASMGKPMKKEKYEADYRQNIELMNEAVQQRGFGEFDKMRRGRQRGVQVQQAQ